MWMIQANREFDFAKKQNKKKTTKKQVLISQLGMPQYLLGTT